jgi:hypothetical protein
MKSCSASDFYPNAGLAALRKLYVFLLLLLPAGTGRADVVFAENFESYSSDSNLNGQGGWSGGNGVGSPSQIRVGPGTGLAGKVCDGHNPLLPGAFHIVGHALPVPRRSERLILTWRGYASSAGVPSTNSGVGFGYEPSPDPFNGSFGTALMAWWDYNQDSGGWTFDTRLVGGEREAAIPNSVDLPVELAIIIDRRDGTIQGRYRDAGRTLETSRYRVSDTMISQLDAVVIFQDQSPGRNGIELDDLRAEIIPSPETPQITGVTIHSVSAEYNSPPWDLRAIHLVDGSGLSGQPPVHAQLNTSQLNSWQTDTSGPADVQFDLGGTYRLNRLHIWNLNFYPPYNGRGARHVRIHISDDAATWREVGLHEFPMATGADGDPGFTLPAQAWGVMRYVRFEILDNWGGFDNAGHIGMSEVAFFRAAALPFAISHFERRVGSGEIVLGFPAFGGQTYEIETTTDFLDWGRAALVVAPADSDEWRVTIPATTMDPARFYRVIGAN